MAITKNDVATAIDTLKSEGKSVTIDGIRDVLGTGSKTTIQRFRKELDAEAPDSGPAQHHISDQLSVLVERLAGRLQEEADAKVTGNVAIYEQKEDAWLARLESQQLELTEKEAAIDQLSGQRTELLDTIEALRIELQTQSSECNALRVEVRSRDQSISDKNSTIQSLEEKHQQAREALNHYRESVKEQRNQDLRRHDQQVQQLQLEIRENRTVIQTERKAREQAREEAQKQAALNERQQEQLKTLQQEQVQLLQRDRDLQQRLEQSESQKQQSLNQNRMVSAELAQMTRQYEALQSSRSDLMAQLRDAEDKLSRSESRYDAQAVMIENFNAQFEKLHLELEKAAVKQPGQNKADG